MGIFMKPEIKPYKPKPRGKRSTRQLIGIKTFGAFGLELYDKSELVLWSIAPSNLSVLSPVNVENKIRALTVVLSTVMEIEFCCLDSSERFDANKQYLKTRMEQEKNPKVRELLAADFGFLDEIQIESSTAREFLVLTRFRNMTPQQIVGCIGRIEKAIKDQSFEVRRADRDEMKRILAIHFEGKY